ncbi:hypothetical protein E2C01_054456 [Portunus trituberculatus]|uniref:Uncharacterized protein n=1 Tax=Portunus trituberculatus TaxID=210409 RepID=A0A5B7GJW1_PORTR|nr:hypothetical protein [Portunus trituberculatus]
MSWDPSPTHEEEMGVHEATSNPFPSWDLTKRFCLGILSSFLREVREDSGLERHCSLAMLRTDSSPDFASLDSRFALSWASLQVAQPFDQTGQQDRGTLRPVSGPNLYPQIAVKLTRGQGPNRLASNAELNVGLDPFLPLSVRGYPKGCAFAGTYLQA